MSIIWHICLAYVLLNAVLNVVAIETTICKNKNTIEPVKPTKTQKVIVSNIIITTLLGSVLLYLLK